MVYFASIFALLLSSTVSFASSSSGESRGFVDPLNHTEVALRKSKDAGGSVMQSCWNFKEWSLIEINDPALVGSTDLTFRYRDEKNPSVDLCGPKFKGKHQKLDLDGGFSGADLNYAFFDEGEGFGALYAFSVFDVKSAKQVFKSTRYTQESLKIFHGKTTSLKFPIALQVDCPLAKEGEKCWEKIQKANNLSEDLHLKMPDCLPVYKQEKSPLENPPQLGTDVVVDDLSKPKIRYLGGEVYCVPAP
jgi:hypothetical protein